MTENYLLLILSSIFGILLFYKIIKIIGYGARIKIPPGPPGIPLLGFMPFLAINPQKVLVFLGKVYGNIYTIYLGSYRVVVLNDYKIIKEAFREDVFSGRPNLIMLEARNRGVRRGLVCSQGKEWIEQRKFAIKQLKDFGFGKTSMEVLIQEEIEQLIRGIRNEIGLPISLQHRFNMAVLNSIWRITSGERYSHDDPRLQNILRKTSADLAETQYTGPIMFLPWLIKLVPGLTRWNEFQSSINSVHTFLQNLILKHKENFSSSSGIISDFIDAYLDEIRNTIDPDSSFYDKTGVVLLDLFMAGGDTTSTSLSWAFLYMCLYPEVQGRVQKEIDRMIGRDNKPSFEHRKQMPYTEATIMEILRKSSMVPMGLFHSTTNHTKFKGFDIPKDTVVLANLHHALNDPGYWGDPENFRPERFLNPQTKALFRHEPFIPFSTGKRVCPGENLARDQIFLFFVTLLQKFTFKSWNDELSAEPRVGVILSPKPYKVIPIVRSNKNDNCCT